jgi:hypothetical protein
MASIKKLLKSAPRMRNTLPQNITRGNGVKNPQKASAYVGKGVLKYGDTISAVRGSITPVPNGPLIKKKGPFKGSTLKKGGTVVKVGGQTHKVFKNKKGDVVVDHTAGIPAGKWDKINLTKKTKAKTVKQGVASVRKWHKDNPDYYKNKKNGKDSKSTTRKKGKA